jgi:hypothetical protein
VAGLGEARVFCVSRADGHRQRNLTHTGPVFDGLYEYYRRATLLGREPALIASRGVGDDAVRTPILVRMAEKEPPVAIFWFGQLD